MEFRKLGGSGLTISEIVYGNLLYPQDKISDEEVIAAVRAARDVGVTTFDTADIYGMFRSESLLGRALVGEPREDLVVCTKVCFPTMKGPNGRGLSRKHIVESIDGSLRRLRLEYLDVYVAHRYDPDTPLAETMQAFADLVRAGKVLYIGVSEWPMTHIEEAVRIANQLGIHLVSNMPRYSMLWRLPEADVFPGCAKLGVGQIPYFTLEQGVLTGKYRPGDDWPDGSRATDLKGGRAALMKRWLDDGEALTRVQRLRSVAEGAGLGLAQLAISWVLQNPDVAGAIVGSSRPQQIGEIATASGVRLDVAMMREIDDVLGPVVQRTEAETDSS